MKVAIRDAIMRLRESASDYAELIQDGRFDLGLYQPVDVDAQTPHARDELYIVARGTGRFISDDDTKAFAPGDVFLVPAGTDHRFVEFSGDFATWVIFFAERS